MADSVYSSSVALDTGNIASSLATCSSNWIIDSGATDHMIGNHHLFSSYVPYATPSSITIANGSYSRVLGSGTTQPTHLFPYHMSLMSLTLHLIFCLLANSLDNRTVSLLSSLTIV